MYGAGVGRRRWQEKCDGAGITNDIMAQNGKDIDKGLLSPAGS